MDQEGGDANGEGALAVPQAMNEASQLQEASATAAESTHQEDQGLAGTKELTVDAEVLDLIAQSESFQMFKNDLPKIAEHIGIQQFADCEQVCDPSIKDVLFVLVEGSVAILDDERIVRRAKTEVRKLRRKRKKEEEKRA